MLWKMFCWYSCGCYLATNHLPEHCCRGSATLQVALLTPLQSLEWFEECDKKVKLLPWQPDSPDLRDVLDKVV